jgi:hypothetical protein
MVRLVKLDGHNAPKYDEQCKSILSRAAAAPRDAGKSFLLLFFKKAVLAFFSLHRAPPTAAAHPDRPRRRPG